MWLTARDINVVFKWAWPRALVHESNWYRIGHSIFLLLKFDFRNNFLISLSCSIPFHDLNITVPKNGYAARRNLPPKNFQCLIDDQIFLESEILK